MRLWVGIATLLLQLKLIFDRWQLGTPHEQTKFIRESCKCFQVPEDWKLCSREMGSTGGTCRRRVVIYLKSFSCWRSRCCQAVVHGTTRNTWLVVSHDNVKIHTTCGFSSLAGLNLCCHSRVSPLVLLLLLCTGRPSPRALVHIFELDHHNQKMKNHYSSSSCDKILLVFTPRDVEL